MYQLNGKTLIFTDLHCGLAGNKLSRLNICVSVVNEIREAVRARGVQNVVFGGDWFHSRSTLDVNTINVAIKLVQSLATEARTFLICGNHDAFFKNSTDVNSLNIFRDTPNVVVVDKPEEVSLNGARCLLVPWLTDLSRYGESQFDVMVGHFEISAKYLIQSYIEDNSAPLAAGEAQAAAIDADALLGVSAPVRRSNDLVGNFVDLVRPGGAVYAGHIHKHKEFSVRGRDFAFVGSPYQQTLGEIDSPCGYYVLDERNRPEFVETKSAPRYVQVFMSEAMSGKFDFSRVAGALVQKVYDVEVPPADEAQVDRKISDFKPYEEIVPDYRVQVDCSVSGPEGTSLETIRRSKLEYIRGFVSQIDQAALDGQGLDRGRLLDMLESYYKKVSGE